MMKQEIKDESTFMHWKNQNQVELSAIWDMEELIARELQEFSWNKVITKNPEDNRDDEFFYE